MYIKSPHLLPIMGSMASVVKDEIAPYHTARRKCHAPLRNLDGELSWRDDLHNATMGACECGGVVAAAMALVTVGFAREVHMPHGRIFTTRWDTLWYFPVGCGQLPLSTLSI